MGVGMLCAKHLAEMDETMKVPLTVLLVKVIIFTFPYSDIRRGEVLVCWKVWSPQRCVWNTIWDLNRRKNRCKNVLRLRCPGTIHLEENDDVVRISREIDRRIFRRSMRKSLHCIEKQFIFIIFWCFFHSSLPAYASETDCKTLQRYMQYTMAVCYDPTKSQNAQVLRLLFRLLRTNANNDTA